MNRRQLFEKYDWLISKTQSILKHYSCPESCKGSCCKNHYIDIYKIEYKKLYKKGDAEVRRILKSNTENSSRSEFYKTIPARSACPFLIDSNCKIYKNRFESCRKFPFATGPDIEAGFVLLLFLCPMSIKIIYDYIQWYKPVNPEMYSQISVVYEQYKNIDKNNDMCIHMNEHNLDSFIEFLENK